MLWTYTEKAFSKVHIAAPSSTDIAWDSATGCSWNEDQPLSLLFPYQVRTRYRNQNYKYNAEINENHYLGFKDTAYRIQQTSDITVGYARVKKRLNYFVCGANRGYGVE